MDGLLVSTGTKWIGFLGTFATFAALDAVSKTNIGQGATATLLDGTEYRYSGTAWVATSLTPSPDGKSLLAAGPVTIPGRTKVRSKGTAMQRLSYSKRGSTTITAARTYDEQWPAFGEFTGIRVGMSDCGAFVDQVDLVAVSSPATNSNQGSGLTWTPAPFDGLRQIFRQGKPSESYNTFQAIPSSGGVVLGTRYYIGRYISATNFVVKKATTTLTAIADYVYNPDEGTLRFVAGGAVSAGDTNITYGAVTPDNPRTLWSDHILLKSAARTDGGIYPLLRVRSYCRGDLNGASGLTWHILAGPTGMADYSIGTWLGETGASYSTYGTGDRITTPGDITFGTTGSSNQNSSQFLIDYVKPCYDVATYGDSIANGASTIDCMSPVNWAAKQCFAENRKYVVSPYNAAVPSRVSRNMFNALAYDLVNQGLRPAFVMLTPGTGNNGNSDSIAANMTWLSKSLDLCDRCGVIPIIETIQPHVAMNTPDATVRGTYNNIIRDMAGNRAFVLDSDLIVRDPANPSQILPAYATGVPEPHINVAGEQAKAAELLKIIDLAVGD